MRTNTSYAAEATRAANGKILMVFTTVAMIILSLVVVFLMTYFDGNLGAMERQDGRMLSLVRLLLTALLGLYLIKGSNVARWLAAILFAATGIIDLVAATDMPPAMALIFATMGVSYLGLFLTMVFNASVQQHFQN